jgi:hypothetical protein
LSSICRRRPRIGLKLAMSLLPVGHDFSGATLKPSLRDFGEAKSRPTTTADVHRAYQQYADLAVELAATDIEGLTALIESLPQLGPATRERVSAAIRQAADNFGKDALFPVWSKLRDLIGRHQAFHEANWALKPDQLRPLEELRDAIQPSDPVRQIQWLFDEYVPREGFAKGADYIGEANRERSQALLALFEAKGAPAVMQLAKAAKLPHFVGVALVESGANIDVLKEALSSAIAPNSGVSPDFPMALSALAHERHGAPWDMWISGIAHELEPGPATNLFLRWADSRPTWDFVSQQPADIQREYWSRKPVFRPT